MFFRPFRGISRALFQVVTRHESGSISTETGLGWAKRRWLTGIAAVLAAALPSHASTLGFYQNDGITLNDDAEADPYPSELVVSGITGTITGIRVKVNGLTHPLPADLDIFLKAPNGKVCFLMSDAGATAPVDDVDLVFSEVTPREVPRFGFVPSGTYRPTNYGPDRSEQDETVYLSLLGINGAELRELVAGDVNGTWSLSIIDDAATHAGSITSWGLQFDVDSLEASYTTGDEVPLTRENFDATGLTANFSLHYAPTPGTTLMVVNNTGPDFMAGQFDNLPNGTRVDLSFGGKTYGFVAWYYGGTGNDLVLLWADTAMVAWGERYTAANYVLGTGEADTDNRTPQPVLENGVLAGKTIVQVVRGTSFTLVLCSDGTVASWGKNDVGQLGVGSRDDQAAPVQVFPADALGAVTTVAIAAGRSDGLALRSDGTLWAWGEKGNGAILGTTGYLSALSPQPVVRSGELAGRQAVAIAVGGDFSLVLCSDGVVVGWGDPNGVGLGFGYAGNADTPSSAPGGVLGKVVSAISAGKAVSLALCADGTLAQWGNFGGQTLYTPAAVDSSSGASALAGKTVLRIVAGSNYGLALSDDGKVAAWGSNDEGELGDGTTTDRVVPVAVERDLGDRLYGRTAVDIAVTYRVGFALCADGSIVSWGRPNAVDQGGGFGGGLRSAAFDGAVGLLARRPPIRLSQSGAMAHHMVAIVAKGVPEMVVEQPSGVPMATGDSRDFGNLLLSRSSRREFTIRNIGYEALGVAVSLSGADADQFRVVTAPASAVEGRDGATTFAVEFVPNSVGPKTATLRINSSDPYQGLMEVSLTGQGSAVLVADALATDVAWTGSSLTATGLTVDLALNQAPTTGQTLRVVDNTGLDFINGVFANLANGARVELSFGGKTYPFVAWYYGGDGNDLVLLWSDTRLAAWGSNGRGQLGDGSVTHRTAPVAVADSGVLVGKAIVQVARGSEHSLALCSDGTVAAWGRNDVGQLGDGTTTDRLAPVAVDRVSGTSALVDKTVIAISAGQYHSLALCSDGTVVAWGLNSQGQLGDGTAMTRTAPTAVNTTAGLSILHNQRVVGISAGAYHSVARCADGSVATWGAGGFGALGNGTTTNRLIPGSVTTSGRTVVEIAAGGSHTLARCADGTLLAWGYNSTGQLGDGTTTNSVFPVLVATDLGAGVLADQSVVALAAGQAHSLALTADGDVAAWGSNSFGQLGDATEVDRSSPTLVNTIDGTSALAGKTVTALAAGSRHSLALASDGTVATWGYNDFGQLGDGTVTARNVPVALNTTAGSSVLVGATVTALAPGSSFSNFSLVIFAKPAPQLVVAQPAGVELALDEVSDFGAVLAGTSSAARTFVLSNPGGAPLTITGISLVGTEANQFSVTADLSSDLPTYGGTRAFTVRFEPTDAGAKTATLRITSNDPARSPFDLTLTGTATTALSATFDTPTDIPLAVNGWTATGKTVDLVLNHQPTPGRTLTVVDNTGPAFIDGTFDNLPNGATVELSFGSQTHAYVAWYYGGDGNDLELRWKQNFIAAWGANGSAQLGIGSTASPQTVAVPVDRSGVLAGKTIVQVARGGQHTLALCADGTLAAWGLNSDGQLGENTTAFWQFSPVLVDRSGALAGKTVVAIAAGDAMSLALCSDGTVFTWGNNDTGQLGDGTTLSRLAPVAVDVTDVLAGKRVRAIAAGREFTLALCDDGTVVGWGYNVTSQLGDNSTTQRNAPVAVDTSGSSALAGRTVVAIAAGNVHGLALGADGTVAAWGDGFSGVLGDGDFERRSIPVAVSTGAGSALAGRVVIEIEAGNLHNLARCADGTVVAWGNNHSGQLGDGTTTARHEPVAVNFGGTLAGRTVVELAAGETHSAARLSDGTVVTWGGNASGQLGDGSLVSRSVPTVIDVATAPQSLADRWVIGLGGSGVSASHMSTIALNTEVLPPPTIDTQPESWVLPVGGRVNLNVGASGDPVLTYQWRRDGVAIPGATAAGFDVLDVGVADDQARFDVIVSNTGGSVTSDASIITVRQAPVITQQPQNLTVTVGQPASFMVEATGYPTPTYQWRKLEGSLEGGTAPTLTLDAVTLADAGRYLVLVTNAGGVAVSDQVELVVENRPFISTSPQDRVALAGTAVQLSVVASSGSPLTYQWRKDTVPLAEASETNLTLSTVTLADAGAYDVVVTDSAGSTTSATAQLTVVDVAATHAMAGTGYAARGTVTVDATLSYAGPITGLTWSVLPPSTSSEPWRYVESSGGLGSVTPTVNDVDLLEWTWDTLPASPFAFSFTLSVPAEVAAPAELAAMLAISVGPDVLNMVVTPDPLVLVAVPIYHSADTSRDNQLDLSELLRVIELYNTRFGTSRTGRYRVQDGTSDGFATDLDTANGTGTLPARFHSADTDHDARLSLAELLRVIELYNHREGTSRTGRYHAAAGSTDGFAPGD